MTVKNFQLIYIPTETLIAEGPFSALKKLEGNYYIKEKHVVKGRVKTSYIPGLCPYKFIYVWMNLIVEDRKISGLAWKYIIPNPIFPMIWFSIGFPQQHPELKIEYNNQ